MIPVVSKDSPFATQLRRLAELRLEPANICSNPEVVAFSGGKNLFDAVEITECVCEILPRYLTNRTTSRVLESSDKEVQMRWKKAFMCFPDLQIVKENYLALDNEVYLQYRIPMVVRWAGQTVVLSFHFVQPNFFSTSESECVKKKDVYEISAGIFLINADVGAIIYDDGSRFEAFGVARSPRLFESIVRKTKWLRDCYLLGSIPPCHHRKNAWKKGNHGKD